MKKKLLSSVFCDSDMFEYIHRNIQIPSNLVPVSILVVAYPPADSQPSPRHSVRIEISDLAEYL